MQNLKSLNNLLTKPVLGRNDDIQKIAQPSHGAKQQQDIYSYEEEVKQMLMKVDEPHRKVLSRQLLVSSYQS